MAEGDLPGSTGWERPRRPLAGHSRPPGQRGTALLALGLLLLLPLGVAVGFLLVGTEWTPTRIETDSATLSCTPEQAFTSERSLPRQTQVLAVVVSTSDCPVRVEILDLRNHLLKLRADPAQPYEPMATFDVAPDGQEEATLAELQGHHYVDVAVRVDSAPNTQVEVVWTYTFAEPNPWYVALGGGLLLLGAAGVLLGVVRLVSVTSRPLLGAPLTALAGIPYAVLPFAYPGVSTALGLLNLPIVAAGAFLIGLAGYYVVEGLARRWSPERRVGVAVAGYFLVGGLAVGLTAWRVRDPFPLLGLHIWPTWVPLMLANFGIVDRGLLALVAEVATVLATAVGVASLLAVLWRTRGPGRKA